LELFIRKELLNSSEFIYNRAKYEITMTKENSRTKKNKDSIDGSIEQMKRFSELIIIPRELIKTKKQRGEDEY